MIGKPTYEELERRVRKLEAARFELEQTEKRLQSNEALLNATQKMGKIGGWEWDVESSSMFWTDELYNLHGLDPGQFDAGAPEHIEASLKCYAPDDKAVIREAFEKCLKQGIAYDLEFSFTKFTGETIWIRTMAEPVVKDGRVEKVVGHLMDITERKQTEIDFKKSANFTMTLLNAIPTPVFYKDRHGKYIGCNRSFTRVMGVATDEIMGRTVHELWPSEHAKVYHQKDLELMKNQKHQVYESEVRDKDGNTRPVIFAKDVFHDEKGEVAGLLGAFLDITDRKQAEVALKKERDRAQQYLDVAGVMFVAIDQYQNVTMINKKGCEILGYEEHEVIGRNWFDHFVQSDDVDEIKWVFNRIISGDIESVEYYENSLLVKNGDVRHIAWHNSIIRDESGRIIGTLSSGEDITERKRVKEHLQQAQKMEAIGTLAGGIAHDFNNILSAIFGYSELSMASVEPGTYVHGNLSKILRASERARDLVQHILTFSRREEREVLPLQIEPIVKEIVKFIRATLPTSIDIRQDIKANPTVIADPTQIHQIIMNLCTNAGHAMQETGGTLYIGLDSVEPGYGFLKEHPEAMPCQHVKLTVSDDGTGIAPGNMKRIFDPYFSTKEHGKGTGLGLATVHGIVKSHRGIVTVESQAGKGTKFEVYLPSAADSSMKETYSEPKLMGGNERILIVDDEEDIIDVEKDILEQLGYNVTATDKASEALQIFVGQTDQFDLVISDMTMPEMTGDKLAAELIKIRPDIPIILCTGFSEKMSDEKAASLGIKGFLMKPVTLKGFSQKVREVIDGVKRLDTP